jgi:UDP-glucose 4-epimerase
MKRQRKQSGLTVALTGATGDLGTLLLPLLEDDERVEKILALDVAPPSRPIRKLEFRRVDLARAEADRLLAAALAAEPVDTFFHLAFLNAAITDAAFAHELEVIGTLHVLTAVAGAHLPRLIVPSMTAVYGARAGNPAYLEEDMELHGCPPSRFVSDKLSVEKQLRAFREHNKETEVVVLRFAPVLGPSVDNPVTRFLKGRWVPTLLGFDPLWQAVHEEDAARALHLALHSDAVGEYNIVGRGVIPLSGMVKLAGGNAVPVPQPLARMLGVPATLRDYIQFSWVADGRRAEEALGYVPRYHARDAATAVSRRA